MSASLAGLDRYSGSRRQVTIALEGPHVVLSVEATSGSNEGEALLTPAQARAVAVRLNAIAELAEKDSRLTGDMP